VLKIRHFAKPKNVIGQCKRQPTAHSSTFGFANAQSRQKNQKSLNFANAPQKQETE
jgi:hypothetical protein